MTPGPSTDVGREPSVATDAGSATRPNGVGPAPRVRPRDPVRTRRLLLAGAVVVGALVFLVVEGLGNATVYFKTADEAVAARSQLGTRRFRIEGVVVDRSVHELARGQLGFTIESNGARVQVVHSGEQPALFRPNIPVVLEGHFAGNVYRSDRILVKHSASYVARHPERVTTIPPGPPSP